MPTPSVLIGSSIPPGPDQVDVHCALKLGDLVLTALPRRFEDALAVARVCRQKQLYLCWSEFCFRGTPTPCKAWGEAVAPGAFFNREQLEHLYAEAGPFYFGRYVIGEIGGVLYWPKDYLRPARDLSCAPMPDFENHAKAATHYVEYCRQLVEQERECFGGEPFLNVESSLLFKYQVPSGLSRLCLEVMPGDPELMHAAIRGAARTHGLEWGTHIAMGWYGGVRVDEVFQKRWRTALGWSYICGADFILPESGHYTYSNPDQNIDLDFQSPEMTRMRRSLREYVQLAHVHRRPKGGPLVRLGLLHGQHDGTPGLWNPFAWGQYHAEHWQEGPAERGWRLFDQLHRREPWSNARVQGDTDFSGNPPLGQVDIVPAEADMEHLSRYACLLCLGWNTMDEELYQRLLAYVREGGHLIMFLPQLRTNSGRTEPAELIHGGDLSELFGVRIEGRGATDVRGIRFIENSGLQNYRFPVYREQQDPVFLGPYAGADVEMAGARVLAGFARRFGDDAATARAEPFLVEHRVGQGTAMLVLAWNWPGDTAMQEFCSDLIRTVVAGEQGGIALSGADRIRFAVYEDHIPVDAAPALQVVYLLNTDPDVAVETQLHISGVDAGTVRVRPGELQIAFVRDGLVLLPETPFVDVERWETQSGETSVTCYAVADQCLRVLNTTSEARAITVNGQRTSVPAGGEARLNLPRRVDAERTEYFAPDFLEEPAIDYQHAELPY
ncbi:MAG: hypothetical protein HN742_20290 [Lentisphaerae bacterium]|jgi:hypothetical protein|nr:hypothetical protein [Lentisphaerota bacterium]MBT5604538.1 hypothetical protein [Lentisphaerota bacterium]MBT7060911.1 hypothetical protein [Lentisphaerota bacterium]MBT7844231.1 hypothetical protein [Lentisphaerota bacterium]